MNCERCGYLQMNGRKDAGKEPIHCKDCHLSWMGNEAQHCVKCHTTFSSIFAADKHRTGESCLDVKSLVSEIGWHKKRKDVWTYGRRPSQ